MNQRTRGAQPVARCGKCGGEDCAFETGTCEVYNPKADSMDLKFKHDPESGTLTAESFGVLCETVLKADRIEWFYTITCNNCDWKWQQLVRETDAIEATSLTKVFAITGIVIAALILITLASLNISIVGWR